MNNGEWLASLKVGDEVVVTHGYHGKQLARIERTTATTLVVGKTKYRKSNGYAVGPEGWCHSRLLPVTDEIREQMRYQQAKDRLFYATQRPSNFERASILAAADALQSVKAEAAK